jgi:hypothetical protein
LGLDDSKIIREYGGVSSNLFDEKIYKNGVIDIPCILANRKVE